MKSNSAKTFCPLIPARVLCRWFLFKMGAIDFADGTVVHISSGVNGLVAAHYPGAGRRFKKYRHQRPLRYNLDII